jgi:hypothetical protein
MFFALTDLLSLNLKVLQFDPGQDFCLTNESYLGFYNK